jgi:hypothetical protein
VTPVNVGQIVSWYPEGEDYVVRYGTIVSILEPEWDQSDDCLYAQYGYPPAIVTVQGPDGTHQIEETQIIRNYTEESKNAPA